MMMRMEDISQIFQEALKHIFEQVLTKHGDKATLSRRVDISTSQLGDILAGRSGTTEEKRRALAAALGYPGRGYEDFLDLGRAIRAGRPPPEPAAGGPDEAGCFHIPLERAGHLAADLQRPGAEETIVVHGPTLGFESGRHLRAFPVTGDSMEPLLAPGGLVVADLTQNRAESLKEGGLYVIRHDGEEAVKFLRWAEKGRLLALESENKSYKPVFLRLKDVTLIGRVIWSCRAHK